MNSYPFTQVDENLTEEERKAAWEEFENEKKGLVTMANPAMQAVLAAQINPQLIQAEYRRQYPHLTDDQVIQATRAYIMQLQSGITRKPAYDKSHYQAVSDDRDASPNRLPILLSQEELSGKSPSIQPSGSVLNSYPVPSQNVTFPAQEPSFRFISPVHADQNQNLLNRSIRITSPRGHIINVPLNSHGPSPSVITSTHSPFLQTLGNIQQRSSDHAYTIPGPPGASFQAGQEPSQQHPTLDSYLESDLALFRKNSRFSPNILSKNRN